MPTGRAGTEQAQLTVRSKRKVMVFSLASSTCDEFTVKAANGMRTVRITDFGPLSPPLASASGSCSPR
jgi:hypothetical protein